MCVYSKSNDAIAALNETNHQNNVGKKFRCMVGFPINSLVENDGVLILFSY